MEESMPQIIVNGVAYSSMDEMPLEIRQAYEQAMGIFADNNKNGMPDILEGGSGELNSNIKITPIAVNSANIIVDGKIYSNATELPPEARQKYEQAMAKLRQSMGDANQNGVPDLLEGVISAADKATINSASPNTMITPSEPLVNAPISDMGDGTLKYKGLLILAGIVIVILVAALIVLGLFIVLPLLRRNM
jgi:hypothetical protein